MSFLVLNGKVATRLINRSALFFFRLFLLGCLSSPITHADNLIEVYNQAINSDPTYLQAVSTWHSIQMNLPIAAASYLTQISINGNGSRNYSYYNPPSLSTTNDYNWQYGYGLQITQPIFNLAVWESIKSANATVKAATASYFAAQQSLILRTVLAYVNVLRAQNTLRYAIANKKSVEQQLKASEVKFKTGVIAIIDVYDARSSLDQITAQQTAAENNLDIALEALHTITGRYYTSLNGITKQLPLAKPAPVNIMQWVQTTEQQNYNIKTQKYNVIVTMEIIKQQSAGSLPSLNLVGGYSQALVSDDSGSRTITDNTGMGLNLSYNPIQGGLVNASTRQARYNYLTAASKLEEVHRQVVSQARNSFVGIMFSIDQVNTDVLRIDSARKALEATEVGLTVGSRTMVDVLSALTTLYQAQQKYEADQYSYIDQFVSLKSAVGTLSVADLVKINSWLGNPVLFHPLYWN